jgi:hypothetical protein
MNQFKTIKGFCPYLDKKYSIIVKCLDISSKTTSGLQPTEFECSYESKCPNPKNCPIAANLPKKFSS